MSAVLDVAQLGDEHGQLIADVRTEVEQLGRLSRVALERLACDCELSRVIMDGPSQVIDAGRTTRTIPARLWRASVVRDRHCRAPGCDRPPVWCEAHHIRHWRDGGPTDLANLQLLCWQHHRERHIHDTRRRG